MVTMTFDTTRRAEIAAHIPAERVRIRELMADGTVEALYIAETEGRVWLVVRGETEDAVRQIVQALPLHAYAAVELFPLANLA